MVTGHSLRMRWAPLNVHGRLSENPVLVLYHLKRELENVFIKFFNIYFALQAPSLSDDLVYGETTEVSGG